MSEASDKQLSDIVGILASLVRSAHLKNVLHLANPDPHLVFWQVIYGNLLDTAVIEWCKLFGSDHVEFQPTHWKNIVPATNQDDFRRDLFVHLQIRRSEFAAYWRRMKDYRDLCAAHDNVKKRDVVLTYPDLDIAVRSSYFYYAYLLNELEARGINGSPKDLAAYCARFTEQAKLVARAALDATASIPERVL